jgi:hypothetical protein
MLSHLESGPCLGAAPFRLLLGSCETLKIVGLALSKSLSIFHFRWCVVDAAGSARHARLCYWGSDVPVLGFRLKMQEDDSSMKGFIQSAGDDELPLSRLTGGAAVTGLLTNKLLIVQGCPTSRSGWTQPVDVKEVPPRLISANCRQCFYNVFTQPRSPRRLHYR